MLLWSEQPLSHRDPPVPTCLLHHRELKPFETVSQKKFLLSSVISIRNCGHRDTRGTNIPHATTAHFQRRSKYCPTLVCHREENGTDREPGTGWRASENRTWDNSHCPLSLLQKHWNYPNKIPILSISSSHTLLSNPNKVPSNSHLATHVRM